MFQKILVPLDNSSYSDSAMESAIAIGKAFNATITGCHVYAARLHETRFIDMETGLPDRYQSEAILKRQREIHESLISKGLGVISDSYLDRFENRCRGEGVNCLRKNREGKNFVEISREIDEGDYDLTVMGSLGMGAVESSLIGGVCERVARKTRKDLLIVKQPLFNSELNNIVVAIDGSPYSYWGLMAAIALKKAWGQISNLSPQIEAVSAFDPYFHQVAFRNIADALSEDAAKVFRFREQEKLHDEIIDKGMAKLYQGYLDIAKSIAKARGVEIKTTLLAGKAYNEILRHIHATKPSLLIMGRFGLHKVDGSDIGSNTENLLRLAQCNIFIGGNGFNPDEAIKGSEDSKGDIGTDFKSVPTCQWTDSALNRLERVPPFARGMAKKAIEDFAWERGYRKITGDIMDEAVKKLLPSQAKKAMGVEE